MAVDAIRISPLLLQCKECASPFERVGRKAASYCSIECRAAHKRKLRKNPVPPTCEMCSAIYVRTSSSQKFCVDCKAAARKAYNKQYWCSNIEIERRSSREHAARQRALNPEHVRNLDRAWKAANWDSILAKLRTPEENAKAARRQRERAKRDPRVAVNRRMSSGIAQSISVKKAGRHWETLVPYTASDLMAHLERQFLPGMTWENRGEWHIDHIVPLASFTFTTPECEEFKAAWALTNLRPLWAEDNLKKSDQRVFLI